MQCKKCGAENQEGSVFCGVCGERLDGKRVCPSCGQPVGEENKFCNHCGARMDGKNVCKTCGTVFEEKFCPNCGAAADNGRAAKAAYTETEAVYDESTTGFAVLSFFFPLIGLILFLVWQDKKPQTAAACGKGALIGVCVSVGLSIILGVLFGVLVGVGVLPHLF